MSYGVVLPETALLSAAQANQIFRTTVLATTVAGPVVCRGQEDGSTIYCELLQASAAPSLKPVAGDVVLVWLADGDAEHGVILGRIGSRDAPAAQAKVTDKTPTELIIQATENLTLKCGEGSITLRADGKILIKGKDLVSQAKCMNRVKGGAVAIN